MSAPLQRDQWEQMVAEAHYVAHVAAVEPDWNLRQWLLGLKRWLEARARELLDG